MYKKALRLTACGLASALLITGSNTTTYAAPVVLLQQWKWGLPMTH